MGRVTLRRPAIVFANHASMITCLYGALEARDLTDEFGEFSDGLALANCDVQ